MLFLGEHDRSGFGIDQQERFIVALDFPVLGHLHHLVGDPVRDAHFAHDFGGEIGQGLFPPALLEFRLRNAVQDEAVGNVRNVGLFVVGRDQDGIRVHDRLDDDFLIEAGFVLVLGAQEGEAVASLDHAFEGVEVGGLGLGAFFDAHDQVRTVGGVLVVRSLPFGRDFDRALRFPDVADGLVEELVGLVKMDAGALGIAAGGAVGIGPGAFDGNALHIGAGFSSYFFPGAPVIRKRVPDFFWCRSTHVL